MVLAVSRGKISVVNCYQLSGHLLAIGAAALFLVTLLTLRALGCLVFFFAGVPAMLIGSAVGACELRRCILDLCAPKKFRLAGSAPLFILPT